MTQLAIQLKGIGAADHSLIALTYGIAVISIDTLEGFFVRTNMIPRTDLMTDEVTNAHRLCSNPDITCCTGLRSRTIPIPTYCLTDLN